MFTYADIPHSFVFDNFTWERDVPEYPHYNETLMPARIPLSSMISGKRNLTAVPIKHTYPLSFR